MEVHVSPPPNSSCETWSFVFAVSYKRLHAFITYNLLRQAQDYYNILTQIPMVYINVDIKLHRVFFDNYHVVIHMHISTVESIGLTI